MYNKIKKSLFFPFGIFFLVIAQTPLAAMPSKENEALLKQISKGFSDVAKKGTPAVVYIESQPTIQKQPPGRQKRGDYFDYFNDEFFNRFFNFPFPDQPKKQEIVRGSGFIVTSDGYIVTNNHVVENASKVNVTLQNGKKVPATVVGTDPKTDLAVIKIEESGLPYLVFGDSDKLEVGDWNIAIGNPFGLQASVTVGVVSAKWRNQLHISEYEDYIQTDAAINPGNSGGPLLNVEGEVIGVNTAIVTGSGGYMGIGFAIPSNMAMRIMDQLIKNGSVTRGYLGVTLQQVDSDLADFYHLNSVQGALVSDVMKGSPADKGGLRQEDVIMSYNGEPVENLSTFRNAVSLMPPGTTLDLKVNREGKAIHVNVTIGSLPEEGSGPAAPVEKLGIKVQNLTPEIAQQLGYLHDKGVVITQVQPGSPAAEAALRPGSLIIAINRKKVATVDEFNKVINESLKDGRVLLMVRQGEAVRFIALHFE